MAVTCYHSTPADGTFSPAGKAAWEDDHSISGLSVVAETGAFADLVSKPTTLAGYGIADAAALAHSHSISDVTGLQTALDAKAVTGHNHDATYSALGHTHEGGSTAWGGITGTLSTQTDLQAALDGKVSITHSHSISHVTGLQAELDGKAASGHNHDAAYEPLNANIQAHVASAHAPSNAQKNSDILKAEIEAVLTGAITSHSHSGGSDPWTVKKLASDVSISTTVVQNISGLSFSLSANTDYMFEACALLRTAATTTNPKIGWAWASGLTDGVVSIEEAQTATTQILATGNINATVATGAGGLPNTTQSWPALLYGIIRAGATPSGLCQVVMGSEIAASAVTIKAGSYLRYRTY